MQMLDNAKRYNDPKSILYKDANKLKKVIAEKCKELGSVFRQGQTWQSDKSRDKKQKLIDDIANSAPEAITAMINKQMLITESQQVKVEPPADADEDDEEEDGDDDDDLDDVEEDEDEEQAAPKKRGKKPTKLDVDNDDSINDSPTQRIRIKNNPLLTAMWQLFDHIKDYQHKGFNIIDPFVKLPSKRLYPDYYQEIKKPIALNTIKFKLNKRMYSNFQVR